MFMNRYCEIAWIAHRLVPLIQPPDISFNRHLSKGHGHLAAGCPGAGDRYHPRLEREGHESLLKLPARAHSPRPPPYWS
jgi:hypothetical protein